MKQYRHLQQFWCWLDDVEEIVELSPFCNMEASRVQGNPPKIFVELRDRAILVALIDCGARGRRNAAVDAGNPAEQERGSFDFDVDVVRVLGASRA
ncbi:hypothetical protein [Amycolatopsis sp. GA6-003]|uniref:hypothetical protein n=1 Tax=Amycolatopsis sp. GA6-003 TaxID=2652444 RepID=UPI003916E89E